jgi:hydroxymethylpyrimidine pyrophosphatase-like HAD family hydrolase
VSHGTTTFVDITNSGVNKASSLQKIARLEEGFKLVGFGSGCNDLGFL